jgi:RHS repeat-associated protein
VPEGEKCPGGSSENASYTYDDAGNEIEIAGHLEAGTTTFAFDNLQQLEALTPPEGSKESLSYLGAGATRLTKLGGTTLENSTLGLTKQTTTAGTSYYARTPEGTLVDERLPGGESYNPVYDAQGDIIGLLNTSGELAQHVRYGPYGENATATKLEYSATNDPFLFQGGYHAPGGEEGRGGEGGKRVPNDLYHFGERFYDPTTGRWTQPDPAESAIGEYAFAEDDPVNMRDPSGELSFGELASGLEHVGYNIVKGAKVVGQAVWHFVAKHTGISSGDTENLVCVGSGVAVGAAGFFTDDPFLVAAGIGITVTCGFVHVH